MDVRDIFVFPPRLVDWKFPIHVFAPSDQTTLDIPYSNTRPGGFDDSSSDQRVVALSADADNLGVVSEVQQRGIG